MDDAKATDGQAINPFQPPGEIPSAAEPTANESPENNEEPKKTLRGEIIAAIVWSLFTLMPASAVVGVITGFITRDLTWMILAPLVLPIWLLGGGFIPLFLLAAGAGALIHRRDQQGTYSKDQIISMRFWLPMGASLIWATGTTLLIIIFEW